MVATTDDELWQAWCADFDDVEHELMTLFHTRWMWRTIIELMKSVPEQYVVVQNYMLRTYVATVCTAIRREADRDARTTSLARCLQGLVDCPHFASRERWVSTALEHGDGDDRQRATRGFDEFGGTTGEFLDRDLVQSDLERLHVLAGPIKKYTNQVIAHRQRRPGDVEAISVSFQEINTALDGLGALAQKYYRLRHPGVALAGLTPVVDLGFLRMFERPWLTPGFVPPATWEDETSG